MIDEKGAEARVYEKDGSIVKERSEKSYRIKQIDEPLRKSRTNREVKVLRKLDEAKILVPKVLSKDNFTIVMEKIEGKKLRDIFEEDIEDYSRQIGQTVRKIHDQGIIHGDLTTSNMIIRDKKLVMIDFGLSFFSDKPEDKAVDLHLLEQAIESKHYKVFDKAIKIILESYGDKETLKRLEQVRERGRNKAKY